MAEVYTYFIQGISGGPGDESVALDHIVAQIRTLENFDWFDAAIMSHQLGQHLAKELKAILPQKGGAS